MCRWWPVKVDQASAFSTFPLSILVSQHSLDSSGVLAVGGVQPLEVGAVVLHHLFMASLVIIARWQLIAEWTRADKHSHTARTQVSVCLVVTPERQPSSLHTWVLIRPEGCRGAIPREQASAAAWLDSARGKTALRRLLAGQTSRSISASMSPSRTRAHTNTHTRRLCSSASSSNMNPPWNRSMQITESVCVLARHHSVTYLHSQLMRCLLSPMSVLLYRLKTGSGEMCGQSVTL